MNLQQSEGERLYDQALSSYSCGHFAQAEQLLDKAIAMEPSNPLFQETRNSFHVTQWHSGYSHHPMASHSFSNARLQPSQQFNLSSSTARGSSRLLPETRRQQGSSASTNRSTFRHAGNNGLWKPPPPTPYSSSTVADSMFGPNYWAPTDGIPNHVQQVHGYSQGQISNPYTARNGNGLKQGTVSSTSRATTQDHVWGQWHDPTVEGNPAGETSWFDSGYQQTEVPWTEEPWKAASLSNNARKSVSCNASQSSLRGSAEKFSPKERHNPDGRISPQTWHSEGTCTESKYGLDNFEDVSNKVQEWLTKNDSSGVDSLPPHHVHYSNSKKLKKKKKKKTVASGLQDFPDEKLQAKGFQHVKTMESVTKKEPSTAFGSKTLVSNTSDVQSGQIPTCTASYHKRDPYERTLPSLTKYNDYHGGESSKSGTNNSSGSKSCGVNNKPFFDPKKIFSSNFETGSSLSSSEKQHDSSQKIQFDTRTTTHCSKSNSVLMNADERVIASLNEPHIGHGNIETLKFLQETETTKEVRESILDTSGSTESDLSKRMTKTELEELIARTYKPFGLSFNHDKSPESVESASQGQTFNASKQRSALHVSGKCSVETSNSSPITSGTKFHPIKTATGDFSRPKKTSKVTTTSTDEANQHEYVNVKSTVSNGALRSSVPVCRAVSNVVSSALFVSSSKGFSGKDDTWPATTRQQSPSCETFVSSASATPTVKSDQCPPSKPVPEAEVELPEVNAKPFVNLDKTPTAAGKPQTRSDDASVKTKSQGRNMGSCKTPVAAASAARTVKKDNQFSPSKPVLEAEVKVPDVNAKPFVNLDKTPLAAGKLQTKCDDVSVKAKSQGGSVQGPSSKKPVNQPSKPFWEPSRIFASKKSEETKATVEIKKIGSSATTNQQMANVAKRLLTDQGEKPTKVSHSNSKSNKENDMPQSSAKAAMPSHTKSSFISVSDDTLSGAETGRSFNDATVGAKYSYVAWKEQKAQKLSASLKKPGSSGDGTKDSVRLSKVVPEIPTEAAPRQDTSASRTKENTKDSVKSHTEKLLDPQTEKCSPLGSSAIKDPPKAAPKAQEFSNCSWNPKDAPTQTQDSPSKGAMSSNATVPPNKHVRNETDRPSSGGTKAKSASSPSSNGPQSRPKYAQSDTQTSYPPHSGRSSTDFSSKTGKRGATEVPRQRTSSSQRGDDQTSGRSSNFRTRDNDFGSTQDSKRNTSEARPASGVEGPDGDDGPWYRWTKVIGRTLRWAVCFTLFLLLILLACLFSTIKIGVKYAWHIIQELRKLIQESRQDRGQRSKSSTNHDPNCKFRAPPQPTRSVNIPTSGEAAIKRLLQCNQGNPYEVLGINSQADQEDIKKNYRKQCMLVHPDKSDLPHAREAFQILQKAYDTLSDPDKRREFEMESTHAHFDEEMEEFLKKMEQKMDEVLNTLMCGVCGGKHRRYEVDRPWHSARYCSRHNIWHSASEGDVWVETSHFGFKWHYYAMMEDRIFNITEWAACQNMKHMQPNTCEIRYRVETGHSRNTSRQRPPGFPNQHGHQRSQEHGNDMTDELLKEFLRQFQQSESSKAGPGVNFGGGDANRGNQDKARRPKKHRKKKR